MSTALLIIDVQRGLFDESPPPLERDAVVARIDALAERARAAGSAVVFVQHERAEGRLAFGSDSWQLVADLKVEASDHKVRKTTPDSFLRTDLAAVLEGLEVSQLVICGYASEYCIDTTTRRALGLGYPVQLVADAHTTHDKDHASAAQIRAHHNATLPDLTSFGPRARAVLAVEVVF